MGKKIERRSARSRSNPEQLKWVMKFDPVRCPTCRALARGTAEILTGVAEFDHRDNGLCAYSGHTEVFFDEAKTAMSDSRYVLICASGHTWLAVDEMAKAKERPSAKRSKCPSRGSGAVSSVPTASRSCRCGCGKEK